MVPSQSPTVSDTARHSLPTSHITHLTHTLTHSLTHTHTHTHTHLCTGSHSLSHKHFHTVSLLGFDNITVPWCPSWLCHYSSSISLNGSSPSVPPPLNDEAPQGFNFAPHSLFGKSQPIPRLQRPPDGSQPVSSLSPSLSSSSACSLSQLHRKLNVSK